MGKYAKRCGSVRKGLTGSVCGAVGLLIPGKLCDFVEMVMLGFQNVFSKGIAKA